MASKILDQPRIYWFIYAFIALAYLLNMGFFGRDQQIFDSLIILLILNTLSMAIYLKYKSRLRINSVAGNTPIALVIAIVAVFGLLVVSTVINSLLGYTTKIMEANSIAMLGSFPSLLLFNHQFISGLILVLIIPVTETILFLLAYDVILSSFHSTYKLNDPKVWVANLVLSATAVMYHYYSKLSPITGQLMPHALIVVFILFFSSGLMAIQTKEMESPIYYHVFNNLLALLAKLKVI